MRKGLLLAMSALFRRQAASAFVQTYHSSLRRECSQFVRRSGATTLRPMGYVSMQRAVGHPSTTSMNLLSRGFSTQHGEQQSSVIKQSSGDGDAGFLQPDFKKGDQIMVEVIFFGPLGASVDVVAHNSHRPADCIPQDEPALGRGMILQSEINYFRRARGGVDIVKYEILPAYVENIREGEFEDEDGASEVRLDISLRPAGGKAKADVLGEQILQKLKDSDGKLYVGDKSSPDEINEVFPGASKSAFKKAVSGLYRRGLVSPGPESISLM